MADDFPGFVPDDSYISSLPPYTSFESDDPNSPRDRWSSFIGIIISIVGNIVISFALNIQKYAHIRLAREKSLRLQERKNHKRRRRRRRKKQKQLAASRNGSSADFLAPEGNGSNGNGTGNGDDEDLESSWVSTDTYDSPEGDEERGRRDDAEEDDYLLESPDRSPSKNGVAAAPPYLRSTWWWAGIILMAIGECGNFLAYGFAPASIVSPLGVVALISNCMIAPLLLKEPFRRRDLLGVVIAITGVGVVVSSSQPKEEKLTPGQIWWEISQTPFEIYFGITCTLIVILLYLSNLYGSKIILIDLGLVGLFGGYTALATKGVSSLLSTSLYKVVTYPVFYLLVFILGLTAVLQIKYLSRSLQRFDSTQVIPTQFVLFNIFTVTGSAILYRDFQKADASRLTKFFTGCLLNFLGVYLISSKRQQNDDDSDYDSAISETEDESHLDYSQSAETPHMVVSSPAARFKNRPIQSRDSDTSAPPLPSSFRSQGSFRRPPPVNAIHSHLRSPPSEASPLLPPLKTDFPFTPPEDGIHPAAANATSRSPSRPRTHDRPLELTTPSASAHPNRSSLSLITPGPLFVGYQLQAVVADTLKRGVDNIIDDDTISVGLSSSLRGRDRRVRKVKSVGGLGGWLRGESTTPAPRERRRRAGTIEGQGYSDSTTHPYSVRRGSSRASQNGGASNDGSVSGSSNHYTHEQGPYPGAGLDERRQTIAIGEGAADLHFDNSELARRVSPPIMKPGDAVEEVVIDGGDAPLPNPATVSPPRERD